MKSRTRLIVLVIAMMMILALPTTALASKKLYRARLTTGAELHEVVDSRASGSMVLSTNQDGTMRFMLSVRNLSGNATAAHIHAAADVDETAGVVITLCGNGPTSAIFATCDTVDGSLVLSGDFNGSFLMGSGMSAAEFFSALNDGLAYVNVHTALNPAGEVRGQLIEQ